MTDCQSHYLSLEWTIVLFYRRCREIIDCRHRCWSWLTANWFNSPSSYISVPTSVELTAAEIERNLHLITDLIFLQVSDFIISPDIHTYLSREISFLIFENKLLFRPSTSCRGACLNI